MEALRKDGSTFLIKALLTSFTSSMHNNLPQSRSGSISHVSRDLSNTAELSRVERLNGHRHYTQVPYDSLSGEKKVPCGTAGSQQTMKSSLHMENCALHGIGTQFDDHQAFPDCEGPTHAITRNLDRPPHHQAFVNRTDLFCSRIVQAHRCSDANPIQRSLSESRSQQPAFVIDASESKPSTHRGYWHRPSSSPK